MKGIIPGLVAAGAVALAPVAARAGTVAEPSLRLTAEERYDDDFRLAAETGGGQLMTKLTPRLGLDVKDPTLTLGTFYAADLMLRHGSGRLSLDHRAGIAMQKELSRRARLDADVRVYRVTDPTSLPRQGLARSLAPILYARGVLGITRRLSQRVDVRAGYLVEGAKVYEPGRETGLMHVPQVDLWLKATRRFDVGAEYRYQGFVMGSDYSQAHHAGAGIRYRLTRAATFSLRGGPVFYTGPGGTPQGVLPRVVTDLAYEGELFDLGVVAGHDLVGASGLETALWADFASLMAARRFNTRWSVFGAASLFRNGRAPGEGAFRLGDYGGRMSQGYAMGAGVESRLNRYATLQGSVDRIAQLGGHTTASELDLTRNVLAMRLMISAW